MTDVMVFRFMPSIKISRLYHLDFSTIGIVAWENKLNTRHFTTQIWEIRLMVDMESKNTSVSQKDDISLNGVLCPHNICHKCLTYLTNDARLTVAYQLFSIDTIMYDTAFIKSNMYNWLVKCMLYHNRSSVILNIWKGPRTMRQTGQ